MRPSCSNSDTIAAVSTPPGPGGIAIIRISGPKALEIAGAIFRPSRSAGKAPEPGFVSHRLRHGFIQDPADAHVLDEALVCAMRAPGSYTGEDVTEIHSHSGPAAVREILALILAKGARPAEPGEFTRRAFLNGRMDLTQAEAVIDIIQSRSSTALRAAAAHLKGGMGRSAGEIRDSLVTALAQIEASIDFSEDAGDPGFPKAMISEFERRVIQKLEGLIENHRRLGAIREGVKIVIAGKPNVGKSTLLNALLGYERAIVSPEPGATRDYISEPAAIQGLFATLIDSAGLRESPDPVERRGIQKTLERVKESDIVLFMVDGALGINEDDRTVYDMLKARDPILTINKTDLTKGKDVDLGGIPEGLETAEISALTGRGLEELKNVIFKRAGRPEAFDPGRDIVPNLRQTTALERALAHAGSALDLIRRGDDAPELAAIELGDALQSVDQVTGAETGEDVLDKIFQTFCVGK
ncbi:tRNA modification GTPase MnmE [Candidatus Desulfarcum epimagneticum]|uniref:tRNA modification GTPase MnmE n=1 Tax=uncultured Desulfobacteraceae bacterium TaxID=218296 RepID=A0A484HDJ0_9BACT|nr:tRNA modification GTPase MnmE [uncultured Desulfobacteraceae bacterium]